MMLPNKKLAFTLVELLVVIAIIGLIASLSVIALGNARQKSRDSKRVADVKQVQTALELFFSDQGRYPTADEWNTGSLYATGTFGTTTYMERIPAVPIGGTCSNDYSYAPNSTGDDYTINFCLESNTGSLDSGLNFAKAASIGKNDPSLVGWWDFENTGSTTTVYDVVGSNNCTWYGNDTNRYVVYNNGNIAGVFNGTNSFLRCGESPELFPAEITMSAWFNASYINPTPGQYNGIMTNKVNSNYGINLEISASFFSSLVSDGVTFQYVSDSSNPEEDIWNYLVVTSEGGVSKLYVNGIYKNSINLGSEYYGSGDILAIGCFYATSGSCNLPFYGMIDDVRVYNRALSDDEILATYNATIK